MAVAEDNPYSTPEGELVVDRNDFGEVKIFGFDGRIGRLRYLARISIMTFITYALAGVFLGITAVATGSDVGASSAVGGILYFAFIIVSLMLTFMFAAQRLHDLNQSGWLTLLMIVPLVNLIFGLYILFASGTHGSNNYGLQPPPNTPGIKIAAMILPAIFIIGIVAAIALPAYVDYQNRAREASSQFDQD
jgi:uncharacterized membrane protein YhaH (DUF805 family)